MAEYQGCDKCKHTQKEPTEMPCSECVHNKAIDHYKPMTNADRIRNMTDEELVKFMDSVICSATYGDGDGCAFPICKSMCGKLCNVIKENTNKYYLEWLQAEVKEGAE